MVPFHVLHGTTMSISQCEPKRPENTRASQHTRAMGHAVSGPRFEAHTPAR
jgi:hypothetical protein